MDNLRIATRPSAAPQAVAVFLFERGTASAPKLPPEVRQLDTAWGGAIVGALGRPDTGLAAGSVSDVAGPVDRGGVPRRVFLVGLGKPEGLDPQAVRLSAAALARALGRARVGRVRLELEALTGAGGARRHAGAVADGLVLASFRFDAFKGAADAAGAAPPRLTVEVPAAWRGALRDAVTVAQAANASRRLSATPPNVADPAYLTARCRAMARQAGLKCRVIDAKAAARLGMGGLLAVGAGGSKPPRLIELEYRPAGAPKTSGRVGKNSGGVSGGVSGGAGETSGGDKKPILLVGKAISFDTGGYSLKVGGSMKGMKYDKCGGMAVFGIMQAVAALKPGQRVVGLIACAENMIDRDAYRVDDILTLANGVTVEVTNTDAEGRLVLADALAYGTRVYKPKAVLDLATLTGGVVVALGNEMAGAWCTDDKLWARVDAVSQRVGEPVWRMPLSGRYREMMRAGHADLHNSAPARAAHPIQGAAFLSYFVGKNAPTEMPSIPWCHLDIAGTATTDTATAVFDKGPTGFGVRLVTDLIMGW